MKTTLKINGIDVDIFDDGHFEWTAYNHTKPRKISTTGYMTGSGYLMVTINRKHYLTHRIIAKAFIPNPNNFPYIDHIDRNKTNNSVNNLRWVTQSTNLRNTCRSDKSLPENVLSGTKEYYKHRHNLNKQRGILRLCAKNPNTGKRTFFHLSEDEYNNLKNLSLTDRWKAHKES